MRTSDGDAPARVRAAVVPGFERDPRPLIMGILNVTPDSFSDGGCYSGVERAVQRASQMLREGADIIDVGGESTRPGAAPVPASEQCRRVVGVIRAVRDMIARSVETGPGHRAVISIDSTSDEVARAALDAGADWINDTSAGRDAPGMLALAAERAAPIVLMHRRGEPATMQDDPRYDDVVAEVCGFLADRTRAALAAGVAPERILLDPGIGFGKRRAHNLALLAGLGRLADLGYPLVLGTSRKRFMGAICAESDPAALVHATCATTALGVAAGVRVFRVHDVAANRQAADTAAAIAGPAGPTGPAG
ncbi:MAG: dihydropteroate synthase [Thiohalocapsa sp.]|nr:dihydropteroate synthase [Thiohalocapsa sp.]